MFLFRHKKKGAKPPFFNIKKELDQLGEDYAEGTEIQTVTMYKLMNTFERIMKKLRDRNANPQHVVVKYNYSLYYKYYLEFYYILLLIIKKKQMSTQKYFLKMVNFDKIALYFQILILLFFFSYYFIFLYLLN